MKIITICISVMICFCGCATVYNPATQKKEFYFIEDQTEISLGKNLDQEVRRQKSVSYDPKLNARLQEVAGKIVTNCDRTNIKYNFAVLNDNTVNAFAGPGGYVFVNKGLMDKVNDHELAFVVGHEIGHVCARHSVKKLQTTLGVSLLASIALGGRDQTLVRSAVGVMFNVASLGYSRGDEFLADSLGLKYATKAGYDGQGAVTLLQKLEAEEKGGGIQLVFLRSHPLSKDRVKAIQDKINQS